MDCKVGQLVEIHYRDYSTYWQIRKFWGLCIADYGTSKLFRNVIKGLIVELFIDLSSPLIVRLLIKGFSFVSRRRKFYFLRSHPRIESTF